MIRASRRRNRHDKDSDKDDRREDRRDWKREKWEHKPRKLLDLVTAGSGLLKWIAILAGLFYGLQYAGGVDLLKLLSGGDK